jgi:hypothetical protein
MWQIFVIDLTQASRDIEQRIAQFLPRLLVMLVIVVVGWLIAYVLKSVIRSILRVTKFDKLSEDAGASQLLKKAALPPSSELLSRFVFWVAWLGFILVGISVLGVVGFEEHITRFFAFLPRLFVAMFVFFFGLLASSFFSRAALLASVNANLPSPKLLSLTIRTMIIVFSISVGVEAVGVGENTMLVAFALMFGALMLGLALAFGLGGQDLARKYLERRFARPRGEEDDDLSPL